MADEKKTVKKEDTSKAEKKKVNPFKRAGKAIAKFFKDLKGETKKIVWPGRKMIIKSTGVVLAAILVIGAGIWVIDYAVAEGVTALGSIATENTTEAADEKEDAKEDSEDKTEDSKESKTEK